MQLQIKKSLKRENADSENAIEEQNKEKDTNNAVVKLLEEEIVTLDHYVNNTDFNFRIKQEINKLS